MRTRTLVVALAIAASVTGAMAMSAHAHTARRYVATYVPGVGVGCDGKVMVEWYVGAVVDPSPVPCMGAVTPVPVSHIDRAVHVRIDDASGARIGGELRFYDQDGNRLLIRDGAGVLKALPFCGHVARAVPGGAASLSVGFSSDACGRSGGVATTGKVIATFT